MLIYFFKFTISIIRPLVCNVKVHTFEFSLYSLNNQTDRLSDLTDNSWMVIILCLIEVLHRPRGWILLFFYRLLLFHSYALPIVIWVYWINNNLGPLPRWTNSDWGPFPLWTNSDWGPLPTWTNSNCHVAALDLKSIRPILRAETITAREKEYEIQAQEKF